MNLGLDNSLEIIMQDRIIIHVHEDMYGARRLKEENKKPYRIGIEIFCF